MSGISSQSKGFTVVELIIVIVIIGILAANGYVSYSGAQNRAREGRIYSDLEGLIEAIELARVRANTTLIGVTGSTWTGGSCMFVGRNTSNPIPNGTDFSVKNSVTQACWDDYEAALDAISQASGSDVRGLKDPWGRPYYIDENDTGGTECHYDAVGWLSRPYRGGWDQNWPVDLQIPTRRASCNM